MAAPTRRAPAAAASSSSTSSRPPLSASSRNPPSSSRIPRGGQSETAASSAQGRDSTTSRLAAGARTRPAPAAATKETRGTGENGAGGNIQVVVRCRGRSEQEIRGASPLVVTIGAANGGDADGKAVKQELSVETCPVSLSSAAGPSSALTLGIAPQLISRTYAYDRVLGPEIDQSFVYDEVVDSFVDETLRGYNCTIFAYGQTGTGKTYTMAGDLERQPLGGLSTHAGIIPRALEAIFRKLAAEGTEFSVRVSFVELYNEELRDLLSSDYTPPITWTQPMGHGAASGGRPEGLRIYDNRKGCSIQGLEEAVVRDASAAIDLLRKGSDRRQMAATKMNDHSSRSHSIFSITVHVKETSSKGEDLIKTGKLNLVDLAGSENVSRSGAVDERAREAGMINKSLLSLGRVISALVDKTEKKAKGDQKDRIPYRDSKLTRLLQDSLGGSTKTCIIATISPVKANLEETLSTLDYALRAKSIENKPHINQRMTKHALLQEYNAEIERLKADLSATREKNGIYLSSESWADLSQEQHQRKVQLDEMKRTADLAELELRGVREQFEKSSQLLTIKESEIRAMCDQLKGCEDVLRQTHDELEQRERELEEEKIVSQAHATGEGKFYAKATGLRDDNNGLFAKIDRKADVETSNRLAVAEFGVGLDQLASVLSTRANDFQSAQDTFAETLQQECRQFADAQVQSLSYGSASIDASLAQLVELANALHTQHDASANQARAFVDLVRRARAELADGLRERMDALRGEAESMVERVVEHVDRHVREVRDTLEQSTNAAVNATVETQRQLQLERVALAATRQLTQDATAAENVRLRAQNDQLASLLEAERAKSTKLRTDLVSNITTLLTDFDDARHRSLSEAVGFVRQRNDEGLNRTEAFRSAHEEKLVAAEAACGEMDKRLHDSKEALRTWGDTSPLLLEVSDHASAQLRNFQTDLTTSTDALMSDMDTRLAQVDDACQDAQRTADDSQTEQRASLDNIVSSARESSRYAKQQYAGTQDAITSHSNQSINLSSAHAVAAAEHHQATLSQVSDLRSSTHILLHKRIREDVPTGETPRKRVHTSDEWKLTGPREELLAAHRRNRHTAGAARPASLGDARAMIESMGAEDDGEGAGLDADEGRPRQFSAPPELASIEEPAPPYSSSPSSASACSSNAGDSAAPSPQLHARPAPVLAASKLAAHHPVKRAPLADLRATNLPGGGLTRKKSSR